MSRYGDKSDLPLLTELRKMEGDFMGANKDQGYRDSVKQAMEWLDMAIRDIAGHYGPLS